MNNKLRVTYAFVLFLLLANTATAQDQPTLAKDSLQITAFTVNVYKGNYDVQLAAAYAVSRQWANRERQPALRAVFTANRTVGEV